MKKHFYLFIIMFSVILVLFIVPQFRNNKSEEPSSSAGETGRQPEVKEEEKTSMANPASIRCEENGGVLEIITDKDGSQLGMCNFEDYSCEEWAYFNGECDLESDAEMIKEALIAKGLNLDDMKVQIFKHMGKYIEGGVVPVSAPAGGGYVFAVKDEGEIKVLADGNGVIMCSSFEDYPDFPTYFVSECVDESGEIVVR